MSTEICKYKKILDCVQEPKYSRIDDFTRQELPKVLRSYSSSGGSGVSRVFSSLFSGDRTLDLFPFIYSKSLYKSQATFLQRLPSCKSAKHTIVPIYQPDIFPEYIEYLMDPSVKKGFYNLSFIIARNLYFEKGFYNLLSRVPESRIVFEIQKTLHYYRHSHVIKEALFNTEYFGAVEGLLNRYKDTVLNYYNYPTGGVLSHPEHRSLYFRVLSYLRDKKTRYFEFLKGTHYLSSFEEYWEMPPETMFSVCIFRCPDPGRSYSLLEVFMKAKKSIKFWKRFSEEALRYLGVDFSRLFGSGKEARDVIKNTEGSDLKNLAFMFRVQSPTILDKKG